VVLLALLAVTPGCDVSFADAVRFLYVEACPRQAGVHASVFDPLRVSVVELVAGAAPSRLPARRAPRSLPKRFTGSSNDEPRSSPAARCRPMRAPRPLVTSRR